MRTSLAVPEADLEQFDATWQAEGIESRSRVIREAMAEYIERHHELETIDGTAVGTVVFDYEHKAVIKRLHEVQHKYQDVIISTSHTHQGEWCLETLFVTGKVEQIRGLIYELKNFDGVRRVRSMIL